MKKFKYIIGSGWWCQEESDNDEIRKKSGDDYIRSRDFHKLWYKSINLNTEPEKIIIVDSDSPIKPDINVDDSRIEFISLDHNAGHATNLTGKYCGWTRSVLLGIEYAEMCDVDYFVYVEQDVLLKGKGIIEHCIEKMKAPYMFGSGKGTPQILQQSFFIIRSDGFREFSNNYTHIGSPDSILSPEAKFSISTSNLLTGLWPFLVSRLPDNTKNAIIRRLSKYDILPIGYGRKRPIIFEDEYFYFQHGSKNEINMYLDTVVK